MKLNLTQLVLTAGFSLGLLSAASVTEAQIMLNGALLTGQSTEKQPQQQLKGARPQGASLTGQTTEKQPQQHLKGVAVQGSSLTGQMGEK